MYKDLETHYSCSELSGSDPHLFLGDEQFPTTLPFTTHTYII